MPANPEIAKIRSLLKSLEEAESTVTHEARATKKTLAKASGDLGFELPPELAEYFKTFGGIYVGGGSAPRTFYSLESAVLRTSEYRSEFDRSRTDPGEAGIADAKLWGRTAVATTRMLAATKAASYVGHRRSGTPAGRFPTSWQGSAMSDSPMRSRGTVTARFA